MAAFSTKEPDGFRLGDWLVEPALGRLSQDGRNVSLEPKTMAVLQVLAEHPGQVLSGDFLITQVWGDYPVGDNPVYKRIAQLRKELGDTARNPQYIATIPKRGYRLVAPVRPRDAWAGDNGPGDSRPEKEDGRESRKNAPVEAGEPIQPRFQDHARRQHPGIYLWISACVISLALVLATFGPANSPSESSSHGNTPEVAIAIVPFAVVGNDDPDPGRDLARQLAGFLELSTAFLVIPFEFPPGEDYPEPNEVAERLGVSHVLKGRIISNDRGNRVETTLSDSSGQVVWEGRYPLGSTSLEDIPLQISREIARQFRFQSREGVDSRCKGTANLQACQHYLLALERIRANPFNDNPQAIDLLHRAIAADSDYAQAYVALARAKLTSRNKADRKGQHQRARLAIQRAGRLDDALPEVLAVDGLASMMNSHGPCPPACFDPENYQRAEVRLRQALEGNPGMPHAHAWLALARAGQGQVQDAWSSAQTAMHLDPLDPMVNAIHSRFLSMQGKVDRARQQLVSIQQSIPGNPAYLYRLLAEIELDSGSFDQALQYALKSHEDVEQAQYDHELTTAYRKLGMFEVAVYHLAALDPGPAGSAAMLMHHDVLHALNRNNDIESELARVRAMGNGRFGELSAWPRWMLRATGQAHSALGQHERALEKLSLVYPGQESRLDHNDLAMELDALHWMAFSLQKLGRRGEADEILRQTLVQVENRDLQGFGHDAWLAVARARAHTLMNQRGLALNHLEKATSRGWRGYWELRGDVRWESLQDDKELQNLLADARRAVEGMRLQLAPELTLIEKNPTRRFKSPAHGSTGGP